MADDVCSRLVAVEAALREAWREGFEGSQEKTRPLLAGFVGGCPF